MPYPQEIRLGIVLYGGVSLAIYENGVAQELFHAVHGDGVYGLLKDLIDSDIVVDIISGTSAGGVNGIYLAYALANGRDFARMSELWREKGDIQGLLRTTNDPEVHSLLDSRGYYQPELEQAFRSLGPRQPAPHSVPSAMEELDLFVTGTDVNGRISTVYDELGHAIDVKDHRTVFQLSWRGTRKNEFDPAYIPEMATLARITSCFPAAFEPVEVDPAASPNLARWGRLHEKRVFLDGGILDNKPFSYTIDAIARRTADRPVQRFLFYVEPAPEQFQAPAKVEIPGIVSAAADALINIPGYESISGDLAAIAAHNDRITAMTSLVAAATPDRTYAAGDLEGVAVAGAEEDPLYLSARLIQLRDAAVDGILNTGGRREHFSQPEVRRAGRILVESFMHFEGYGGDPAPTLRNFDVYFRLRRLFHLARALEREVRGLRDPEAAGPYRDLWRSVNHQIKVLEIIAWAMEWYVGHAPIEWKSLDARFRTETGDRREPTPEEYAAVADQKWGQVERGLRLLLDARATKLPEREDETARQQFYVNLKARVEELTRRAPAESGPLGTQSNLLDECDGLLVSRVREWSPGPARNTAVQALCGFLGVDRRIFPLQFASGIHTRDLIRVVRLSPADANRAHSGRPLREKVCGKAVGAFGGFFKKPWRSNDIMWGRLDAVCQILECALTRARVREVHRVIPGLEARLQALFKTTGGAELAQLANDLNRLVSLTDREFADAVTRLIAAAQEEIIAEEWPKVIRSSMEQEREWSRYKSVKSAGAQPPYDSSTLVWVDPKSTPDYLIVQTAAAAVARGQLPKFSDCKVAGRPFLDEIPRPVLLELASRAAMRLEKSLMASAPKLARIPVLHSSIFGLVLPGVYGWSTFHRKAPEWRVAMAAALLAASFAVLALMVLLWTVNIPIPWKWLGTLGLGSLAVITVWFVVFRPPRSTRARVLFGVLLALALLGLIAAGGIALVSLLGG